MRATRPFVALAALVAATFLGCTDEAIPNLTGINPVSIMSVSVIPGVDTLLVIDTITGAEQVELTALVETRSGVRSDLPVAWRSSNTEVATVDGAGVVTARGYGTTVITASASREGTAMITVAPLFQADTLPNVLVSVSAGDAFTCGVTQRDRVYCWGRNSNGQLGGLQPDTVCVNEYFKDRPEDDCSLIPVRAAAGPFTQVDADSAHACALGVDGRAYCWGNGAEGRLGTGTTSDRAEPRLVSSAQSFVSLTTGGAHSCALTAAGAAWCWGADSLGQLGNSLVATSTTPIPVDGGLTFTAITAGREHTCGLAAGGQAFCWGNDSLQQLGNGDNGTSRTPVAVQTGLRFTSISAGALHTCAVTASGQLACWGHGSGGRLDGISGFDAATPLVVPGSWTAVAAGGRHTCAANSGGVSCWGEYDLGVDQLGNPRTEPVGNGSTSVTTVLTGAVKRLTAGERHACAVLVTGGAQCWGSNVLGAFGDGLQALLRRSPQPVRALQ